MKKYIHVILIGFIGILLAVSHVLGITIAKELLNISNPLLYYPILISGLIIAPILAGQFYSHISESLISKRIIFLMAFIGPFLIFLISLFGLSEQMYINPFSPLSVHYVITRNIIKTITMMILSYFGILLGTKISGKLGKKISMTCFFIGIFLYIGLTIGLLIIMKESNDFCRLDPGADGCPVSKELM